MEKDRPPEETVTGIKPEGATSRQQGMPGARARRGDVVSSSESVEPNPRGPDEMLVEDEGYGWGV